MSDNGFRLAGTGIVVAFAAFFTISPTQAMARLSAPEKQQANRIYFERCAG